MCIYIYIDLYIYIYIYIYNMYTDMYAYRHPKPELTLKAPILQNPTPTQFPESLPLRKTYASTVNSRPTPSNPDLGLSLVCPGDEGIEGDVELC